jgi:hypothetical protein
VAYKGIRQSGRRKRNGFGYSGQRGIMSGESRMQLNGNVMNRDDLGLSIFTLMLTAGTEICNRAPSVYHPG